MIFAAVMPTGHVMLQEFTDALVSLNWENTLARPIEFRRRESINENRAAVIMVGDEQVEEVEEVEEVDVVEEVVEEVMVD